MELNINSPAYFTEKYGIDEAVYDFCRDLRSFFKNKEYSKTLHTIGVLPIIAPQAEYDEGLWAEDIRFLCNNSIASISVRMDFEGYLNAETLERLEMIKSVLLKAVKRISVKRKFDYGKFEADFLYYCNNCCC